MEGIVKEWRKDEGFGWIRVENEEDVWVHFSAILPDPDRFPRGYRYLLEGQRVEFDLVTSPHSHEQRRSAKHVVVKDAESAAPSQPPPTQDILSAPTRRYPQRFTARTQRFDNSLPDAPTR